jgi:4-amino-4-deoxy-L-arabinose transferase-like glycosyltransferase
MHLSHVLPRPPRRRVAVAAAAVQDAPAGALRTPRPARVPLTARTRVLTRIRPELAGLLVLTAALNLWSLSLNGWANTYYAATVRSMTASWHNFLYASFDPAGVMTVDKPPLGLWVQALSARVFGFHPLSLLVPQALMGVAAVALVYDLTRRRFGRIGGAVAGLVLATTPTTVAISRHDNPDALLVLCCVAALWFAVRAFEDGRTRWLLGAGICVGLGFETKMAVALMVVPGIAAAWLWVAPRGRVRALRQLLAGGAAMVAVGGAWPLLVALTPAADRPWISGTSDNSIWSLILGYNGVGRLSGQTGGPAGIGGGPGGGANTLFGGATGPFRLLGTSLGGQAGWLIGFAVVGGLAVLVVSRLRRTDPRTGWLLATGGAFLTTAVAFSFAQGIFHPYYVSLLAPFIAALVGAGAAQLLARDLPARILGPVALAAGVACELVVLNAEGATPAIPRGVLVAACAAAGVALAASAAPRVRRVALGVALAALIATPAVWAVDTLGHATAGTFPTGGPVSASVDGPGGGGRFGGGGRGAGGFPGAPPAGGGIGAAGARPAGPGAAGAPRFAGGPGGGRGAAGGGGPFGGQSLTGVLAYVRAHGGGTVAISSQSGASASIIASGADVAGIGGFSGRESQVTTSWLAGEIASGHIRWVLTDSAGGSGGFGGARGDTRVGSKTAMAAVAKTCRRIPSSAYASSTGGASGVLYDCSGAAAALLATTAAS